MQELSFEDAVEKIVAKDNRYDADAYEFLREALDFTQKSLNRSEKSRHRDQELPPTTQHVTGKQLLEGIREFAVQRYGPMTLTVLESWGVTRCEDFGEIVFSMVDAGVLGKTDTDTPEDFKAVYDFKEAFYQPFLPKAKQATPPSQPTSTNV